MAIDMNEVRTALRSDGQFFVEGGEGDDYDFGRIVGIDEDPNGVHGGRVQVAWTGSQTMTPAGADALTRISADRYVELRAGRT